YSHVTIYDVGGSVPKYVTGAVYTPGTSETYIYPRMSFSGSTIGIFGSWSSNQISYYYGVTFGSYAELALNNNVYSSGPSQIRNGSNAGIISQGTNT
ncbi:hypothetical protein, partial [Escherichia coli]|uniref:hypothetical protein n=1 Tax=Escherichia coli TaxID=562 RepID=UPI00200D5DE2